MSNKINAIRGMNDCLPKDSHLWLSLEKIIFDTFITYGFKNNFMKHSHSFAMTIFHKITKSTKLVILLIIPTYAKVSVIYLLIIPFGTCPAGTYSAAVFHKIVKLVKNGVLIIIHIYAKVSHSKIHPTYYLT
jgi:hypothetical protein